MGVNAGYKQTQIGVIPEDWRLAPLQKLSAFITKGATPTTYGFSWEEGGVVFLRSECVSEHGLDLSQSMFISPSAHDFMARSRSVDGDILITITGNVGRVVRLEGVGEANLNQHIARVRVEMPSAEPGFVYQYMSQDSVRQRFIGITTGQAYPQISLQQVRSALVPLPPLPEQRAISKALGDVDDQLQSLDQIIAKKRDLKQAAMQELLTGRKQLPGFAKGWKSLNLAKVATLKARIGWQGLTTHEYLSSGVFRLVTGTEFHGGRIDWDGCYFVAEERYLQDPNIQLKIGDVLLTKDGTIGKTAYVTDLAGPATLNSGVFVIRPRTQALIPEYLYFVLTSRIFIAYLAQLQAGSTISHLYQKDFVNFAFEAPSPNEQAAIATVLSDMDAEIELLEARRDKTRLLKQGMMQELLTGRTRLV